MQQAEIELLVIAAQDGDLKAFETLYAHHHQSLLRYAYRLTQNLTLAEDATQEAWINIAKNIRKIDDTRAFKSWIYKLVRWRATDLLRAVKKSRELESTLSLEIPEQAAPNDYEGESKLSLALDTLPETEKQILHLFYLDQLKIKEIANVLSIPAGTVKSRLNRARTMLKGKFTQ